MPWLGLWASTAGSTVSIHPWSGNWDPEALGPKKKKKKSPTKRYYLAKAIPSRTQFPDWLKRWCFKENILLIKCKCFQTSLSFSGTDILGSVSSAYSASRSLEYWLLVQTLLGPIRVIMMIELCSHTRIPVMRLKKQLRQSGLDPEAISPISEVWSLFLIFKDLML